MSTHVLRWVWTSPSSLPGPGDVHVWHHELKHFLPDEIGALGDTLSIELRSAADRFLSPVLRNRYIVSQAMTASVLGVYACQAGTPLVLGVGRYGKPCIVAPEVAARIQFNVSHSAGATVVAVTTINQVGIDIEKLRTNIVTDDIASKCFTKRELAALSQIRESDRVSAFFACWTRKESLLKAQGIGLVGPLNEVQVGLGNFEPLDDDEYSPMGWALSGLDIGPGYAGAVATEGSKIRIHVHAWEPREAYTLQNSYDRSRV